MRDGAKGFARRVCYLFLLSSLILPINAFLKKHNFTQACAGLYSLFSYNDWIKAHFTIQLYRNSLSISIKPAEVNKQQRLFKNKHAIGLFFFFTAHWKCIVAQNRQRIKRKPFAYLSRPSVKLYCIHKHVMQCVNVQYGLWFAERGAQHWNVELSLPMCLCLCETHVFEFSTSSASYVSRTNQLRDSSANLRADWQPVHECDFIEICCIYSPSSNSNLPLFCHIVQWGHYKVLNSIKSISHKTLIKNKINK